MKKVRWGLIGPGSIAHTFARDIAYADNAVLQAVGSRTPEKAQPFADEHKIPLAYGSYEALFADPDIDAVYIATPHTRHVGQTLQAISAGKSVLCEKPFTVTPDECEQIIEQASNSNVTVMEALWTYFLPAMQKAKAWVNAGCIGKIVHIESSFGYPQVYDPNSRLYNKNIAGGCLLDMGIYPIATNWLFTQEEPLSINVVSRFAPNGVEDDVVMLFNYADKVSTLSTSFRARLPNWTYVIGEKGYIAIPDSFRASECFLYELDTQIDHFADGRKGSGFEFQIQAISEDILNGRKESSIVPLQTSLMFQKQMAMVKATFSSHN